MLYCLLYGNFPDTNIEAATMTRPKTGGITMAFCGKCGTQLKDGAKFCPMCGATTEEKKKEPEKIVYPTPDPEDFEQNRTKAVFSYLSFLVLIPLISGRKSKFARFHANQGLVLFLLSTIGIVVCAAIAVCGIPMVLLLPPIGAFLLSFGTIIGSAIFGAQIGLSITGIRRVYCGLMIPLFLIGKIKLLK